MPAGLRIRLETDADHQSVSEVVTAAFGSTEEARLVEAIRASSEFISELTLVADDGGRVVGHVMISYAAIADGELPARVRPCDRTVKARSLSWRHELRRVA